MNKKIISIFVITTMIVSTAALLAACGSKAKEPKTLEDYIAENEDAAKEIEELKSSMSGEQADGDISITDNTISITMKLKETYESDYLDTMKEVFEKAIESQETTLKEQISDLEEKSEIDGISMVLICQNGDGTELINNTITA